MSEIGGLGHVGVGITQPALDTCHTEVVTGEF
jgi:hypothetical protein